MSKIMFKLMSTCHLGPRPPVDTQFQTNRQDKHTYNPRPRIRHFDNILGLCSALKKARQLWVQCKFYKLSRFIGPMYILLA